MGGATVLDNPELYERLDRVLAVMADETVKAVPVEIWFKRIPQLVLSGGEIVHATHWCYVWLDLTHGGLCKRGCIMAKGSGDTPQAALDQALAEAEPFIGAKGE